MEAGKERLVAQEEEQHVHKYSKGPYIKRIYIYTYIYFFCEEREKEI